VRRSFRRKGPHREERHASFVLTTSKLHGSIEAMFVPKYVVPLVAALTLSDGAHAQEARPIRFWAPIIAESQSHNYQVAPNAVIPTLLVGWTCKTTEISLRQWPGAPADPAFGLPSDGPRLFQTASLVCSSKSGSVRVTATCTLSSADEHSLETVRIDDTAGHWNLVGMGCRN
jgi:hypothetical protein